MFRLQFKQYNRSFHTVNTILFLSFINFYRINFLTYRLNLTFELKNKKNNPNPKAIKVLFHWIPFQLTMQYSIFDSSKYFQIFKQTYILNIKNKYERNKQKKKKSPIIASNYTQLSYFLLLFNLLYFSFESLE